MRSFVSVRGFGNVASLVEADEIAVTAGDSNEDCGSWVHAAWMNDKQSTIHQATDLIGRPSGCINSPYSVSYNYLFWAVHKRLPRFPSTVSGRSTAHFGCVHNAMRSDYHCR